MDLWQCRWPRRVGGTSYICSTASGSKARVDLAYKFGADDVIFTDKEDLEKYPFPRGGVDKVLVTSTADVRLTLQQELPIGW